MVRKKEKGKRTGKKTKKNIAPEERTLQEIMNNQDIDQLIEYIRCCTPGPRHNILDLSSSFLEKHEKGVEIFLKTALTLEPNNAEHHYNYALYLETQHAYKKAQNEFETAIKLDEDSSFFLKLGPSSSYRIIQGDPFPILWKKVINEIIEQGRKKILILGGIDTGKSTFCLLLANSILKFGIQSAIIDADIGQSDLGPPTTLGLGLVNEYIKNLSSASIINLFFVGHITPYKVTNKVILGIKMLCNCLKLHPFTIINTDGWIKDNEAIAYKKRIIDELSPDLIIGISERNEIANILENCKKNFVLLDSSKYIKKRNQTERRKLREYGYRKFLENAKLRLFYFNEFEMTERINEFDDFKDNIVGFIDRKNFLQGIGIMKDLNKDKKIMKIFTSIKKNEELRKLEIGNIKISNSGREF